MLGRLWFSGQWFSGLLFAAGLLTFVSTPAAAQDPLDWPYWRGPEMNGISREKNLPDSWSPDGENLIWKSEALGTRSTPIVMRGKLYTLARHKPATLEEAEKVICADAETGEVLWEHIFNVFLSDVPDTRVAWSSVVGDPETGNVFALGVCGDFFALNGETGKPLWNRSLSEEFGLLTTYGGRTNFPILHENLVIISGVIIGWGEMARPAHRILAFDKRNGQCVWFQSTRPLPEDTTYSSPVLATIGGQTHLMLGTGDGSVYSFQPRTGKVIWNYDVSLRGLNTPPVVIGSTVICGHSEENLDSTKMGALFAIDGSKSGNITKTGELWRTTEEFIGKTQPIVVGDRIYSIDDSGNFFINDLKTGEIVGKQKLGTMGRGSPVYADGKFYCVDATGRWSIFEADEAKGLKKVHQLRLDAEVNGSPIISHGRIYLPTDEAMYCIGKKDVKPSADPIPKTEIETPADADRKPAQALLVPAETLMKPGKSLKYQVFLYNANGRYLGVAPADQVKYSVAGKGEVKGGNYTVPEGPEHHASIVTAEVNGITATARVRVVPDFPWSFTFDDGVVPITGVGLRYRHIGLDFDLYQKLKAENRLAARCYLYLATRFTNVPAPLAKFDDTTPAQDWTSFKRYLGLLEQLTNQDEAKAALDPALKLLQDEQVIAKWEWTGAAPIGTQLQVTKGPRKVTGNGVLCKISTIPKGTRSQGWLGHPDSANYEIQADFFPEEVPVAAAADKNAKLADVGLICQRYRFDMQGPGQKLKLYSWIPHDQKYHDQPYEWTANAWYTLKFRVTMTKKDGEDAALLQGKVWKRDEAEPKDWSVEWTDSPPNTHGSPGLFGNAGNAEIFIDNLKVTPLN